MYPSRLNLSNFFSLPDIVDKISMTDEEDQVQIQVEIPGYEKDEVNVELVDNLLKISAQKEKEDTGGRYRGQFYQSFRLSKDFKSEEINASLENGLLTVRLPRSEKTKPRKIAVN